MFIPGEALKIFPGAHELCYISVLRIWSMCPGCIPGGSCSWFSFDQFRLRSIVLLPLTDILTGLFYGALCLLNTPKRFLRASSGRRELHIASSSSFRTERSRAMSRSPFFLLFREPFLEFLIFLFRRRGSGTRKRRAEKDR